FGGQTPLRLSVPLARAGVPIVGTTPDSLDRAEDRERFEAVLAKLDLRRPPNGLARSDAEAIRIAEAIRYPVLVRPSYVLGGRAMEIVYDRDSLARYMRVAVQASPAHPVLIDKFLEDAIEVDVDAVSDGTDVVIGGIMAEVLPAHVSVKEAVFPFIKFPGVDTVLGPEMKSTGEVMGIDGSFGAAFAKAQVGAGTLLPTAGRAFLSVPEVAKDAVVAVARRLAACGFTLVATRGPAAHLRAAGLPAETI